MENLVKFPIPMKGLSQEPTNKDSKKNTKVPNQTANVGNDIINSKCSEQFLNQKKQFLSKNHYFLPYGSVFPPLTELILDSDTATKVLSTICLLSRINEAYSMSLMPNLSRSNQCKKLYLVLNNLHNALGEYDVEPVIAEPYLDIENSTDRFVIYDNFFHVTRFNADKTNSIFFLKETVRIFRDAIQDLAINDVSGFELTAIFRAMGVFFNMIGKELRIDFEDEIISCDCVKDFPSVIIENPIEYAHKRWQIHHLLFAIFCIGSKNVFELATATSDDTQKGVYIYSATDLFRGTTAAMWAATGFPKSMYINEVRPSMNIEKAPNGFTGGDNSDFLKLMKAKKMLFSSLEQQISINHFLHNSIEGFYGIFVSDMVSHRQLAFETVQMECSLLQGKIERLYGEKAESAIDILDRYTQSRREESVKMLAILTSKLN